MKGAGGGFAMKADRHRASCAGRSGGGGRRERESSARVAKQQSRNSDEHCAAEVDGREREILHVSSCQSASRSVCWCLSVPTCLKVRAHKTFPLCFCTSASHNPTLHLISFRPTLSPYWYSSTYIAVVRYRKHCFLLAGAGRVECL